MDKKAKFVICMTGQFPKGLKEKKNEVKT